MDESETTKAIGAASSEARLQRLIAGARQMINDPQTVDLLVRSGRGARFSVYHRAAAVVSSFDPEQLTKIDTELDDRQRRDAINDLLDDSEPISEPEGRGRWVLNIDVRREVIREMGDKDALKTALASIGDGRPADHAQRMFEAYLSGTAEAIDAQSIDQLAGTFQVTRWFEDVPVTLGQPLPTGDEIRARSDYVGLLQPFFDLAGEHFAGRVAELKELRDYVGVQPPGSPGEVIRRAARSVIGRETEPPLLIHGPGGMGKSALIARFIWEHATLPDAERFPFAYLDFDRPSLLPEEPLTILAEVARQLGLQHPTARRPAERIRRIWMQQLADRGRGLDTVGSIRSSVAAGPTAATAHDGPSRDWTRPLEDFGDFLATLAIESRPLLLVLDTFEEVQYRSEAVVLGLFDFLRAFQAEVPRLRIVIAGRSALEDLPDLQVIKRELRDFDSDASVAYLKARGVEPASLARTIANQVGGSPLSLWLAAELWKKEGSSPQGISDLDRGRFLQKLQTTAIQGQLYDRILGHIDSEEVKKLAHPGLVLRGITPEVIRHVLAGPCGVEVSNDAEAERLYGLMRREVALVISGEGGLRHRRDVRLIMLGLLRADEKYADQVALIEDGAIAFYMQSDAVSDRAEEIYHRLSRRQPFDVIAERWLPGVEQLLFGALDPGELELEQRAWLANRLGRSLKGPEKEAADLQTWEADAARTVEELLARNQLARAMRVLGRRVDRSPASPLFALEAVTLIRQGKLTEAQIVFDRGIQSVSSTPLTKEAVALRIGAARLDLRLGDSQGARRRLDESEALLADRPDRLRALEIELNRLEADRLDGMDARDDPQRLDLLHSRFTELGDDDLVTFQALTLWAGAELVISHVEDAVRAIRAAGISTTRRAPMRALARALATWDKAASEATNQWQGSLARDLPWGDTLTDAWTTLVRDAQPSDLSARVANLLASIEIPTEVRQTVVETVREVLAERAAELAGPSEATGPLVEPLATATGDSPYQSSKYVSGVETGAEYQDVGLELSPDLRAQLQACLLDAFTTRDTLAEMLRYRLNRTLDSISISDDLETATADLVRVSAKDGWTASLIAAAVDSRPGNARLRNLAAIFGLSLATPHSADLEASFARSAGLIDPLVWRSRLGFLEGQICRVEHTSGMGTGFIVGPDLVLTAAHVIQPLVEAGDVPRTVALRFDYKQAVRDTVNPGTVFRLADRDWLVAHSPSDELDYALLRMAGAPGIEPIGGDRAEPTAETRGWIELPRRPVEPPPGSPILIVHHPRAGPLVVGMESEGVVGLTADGTRLHYRLSTEPGSGGAPCFDFVWTPIAIHLGRRPGDPGIAQGVPMAAVLADLDRRGARPIFEQRPA